ncbi:hypothetical protein EVAR_46565_1 [Eumeta japonica]|uniref:Uncharacterized protein n=1 Tax=Eumeta variegata TaxID=151549 RepID=A0A4C1XL61_EUMVA|nr:hypothetical protein EVAR_46565_1 [Eumeta japonica]
MEDLCGVMKGEWATVTVTHWTKPKYGNCFTPVLCTTLINARPDYKHVRGRVAGPADLCGAVASRQPF